MQQRNQPKRDWRNKAFELRSKSISQKIDSEMSDGRSDWLRGRRSDAGSHSSRLSIAKLKRLDGESSRSRSTLPPIFSARNKNAPQSQDYRSQEDLEKLSIGFLSPQPKMGKKSSYMHTNQDDSSSVYRLDARLASATKEGVPAMARKQVTDADALFKKLNMDQKSEMLDKIH